MKRQFDKWFRRWVSVLPFSAYHGVINKTELKAAYKAGFRAGRAHTERLSKP